MTVGDNLIDRDFSASGPNEKWLGDITYLMTREGWLFLAAILDCFSRYVVGWAMGDSIEARLVHRALHMAIVRRDIGTETQLIHHSDRGSQYSSGLVQQLFAENDATFFRASNSYGLERLFVQLLDGNEFVVRFTPYSSDPITATFSLMGLTAAARREGIDVDAYRAFLETNITGVDSLSVGDIVLYSGLRYEVLEVLRGAGRVQLQVLEEELEQGGEPKGLSLSQLWVRERECRRVDPED